MASEKDRHSRMAYSTVKAPPKKDGGGGKYTWGADTDPTNFNYVSVPHGHMGVVTMPAPTVVVQPSTPTVVYSAEAADFPALGSCHTVQTTPWGPSSAVSMGSTQPSFAVASTSELVQPRTAPDMFGPQHPRNLFAPRPRQGYVATSGVVAIDWNAAGIPATPKATNAAHLSAYAAPAPPVASVAVLRQQQPVRMFPAKVMKAQKPVVIHQPQQRR